MWIVEYNYYDFHQVDSAWYSQTKALERASDLNKKRDSKKAWDVKWVRVGDELE